ncbi:MAG: hypothetical protein AAGC68_13165, partial [Verrucomicrobiota bacterium]
CVFYNALTGQYPFNGETAPQVMNAHLQHKVVPLDQVRPDLPPSTCQWVMWLINRYIDHRPADARDALKRWPKDAETGAVPVAKALPVEETPNISTGEIKIVTAASQASAPPSLIVTGTAPNSPVGARTGRLQTGSSTRGIPGPLRNTSRGNVRKKQGPNKLAIVIVASIISAIAIMIALSSASKAKERANADRMIELASSEETNPEGSLADVEIAVGILESDKTSLSLKGDATKVLGKLEATGLEEKLLTEMQTTESTRLKLRLAKILSDRGYTPAVSEIITAFKAANSDEQRVQFLNAARALADMDSIEEILGALQGDHSLAVRKTFEDTVLAVLRKSDNPDPVIDTILTKVSSTSGNERKSLFRILGVMGGEDVKTRLTSIYNKKNDPSYQRDAMIAYLNWNDRSVIPDVEEIIKTTDDTVLRGAAEKALGRLVTLPTSEPVAEKVAAWDRAFQATTNPNDARKLIAATLENPSPQAVQILRKWSNHDTFGALAKGTVGTVQKLIAGVPVISAGDKLKGNKARVQGDNRVAINSFLESLTGWVSPETWFTWNFKVGVDGTYAVEIDQACLSSDPSEFEVYLGDQTFRGESVQTKSLEEFTPVKLPGTVDLKAEQIYTLTLRAGRKVQPRMMDIGAVRLVAP